MCVLCGRELYLVHGLCPMHYQRWRRFGDPFFEGNPNSKRQRKAARKTGLKNRGRVFSPEVRKTFGRRIEGVVGYMAAHRRVRYDRGPASDFTCRCGQPGFHWAFLWREAKDRIVVDENGRYYSMDVNDYEAMCARCAKWYDMPDEVRAFAQRVRPKSK